MQNQAFAQSLLKRRRKLAKRRDVGPYFLHQFLNLFLEKSDKDLWSFSFSYIEQDDFWMKYILVLLDAFKPSIGESINLTHGVPYWRPILKGSFSQGLDFVNFTGSKVSNFRRDLFLRSF